MKKFVLKQMFAAQMVLWTFVLIGLHACPPSELTPGQLKPGWFFSLAVLAQFWVGYWYGKNR